jgi:hypothetical protein
MKGCPLPALVLLLTGAMSSAAAGQQRIIPFLGGGLAAGVGDLSRDTGNGWLVFAGADVLIARMPGLSAGLSASYTHIPYQGTFGEATNIAGLLGEVAYVSGAASPRTVKPYLRGGLGVLRHEYDGGSTGYRSKAITRLALSAGGGVTYAMAPVTLLAGIHYTTGADAGFLAFHGGVAYPLGGPRSP